MLSPIPSGDEQQAVSPPAFPGQSQLPTQSQLPSLSGAPGSGAPFPGVAQPGYAGAFPSAYPTLASPSPAPVSRYETSKLAHELGTSLPKRKKKSGTPKPSSDVLSAGLGIKVAPLVPKGVGSAVSKWYGQARGAVADAVKKH